MSTSRYGPNERDVAESGPRTDVGDEAAFASELVRFAEDRKAEDFDQLEARAKQFLSDIRRHNMQRGGSDE